MGALALAQVLRPLREIFPAADHPELLVGLTDPDDAAVYRIAPDMALVVTTDFFPPVVDDPYDFGAIAANNAMSDVFAMGGEVLLALNLLALPDDLPAEVAAEIVRGGAEAVRAAGGVVAGGHSVVDREPKFGLAVVGRVAPDRCLRKSGVQPGDRLFLSKALGTGLITTALKRGLAQEAHVEAAVASMKQSNRDAGLLAAAIGAHAATDITGYGLLGHGLEMSRASGLDFEIDAALLPLLPGAADYARAGIVPGGTDRNREAFSSEVDGLESQPDWLREVVFDPQTSGGLLIAISKDAGESLRSQLLERAIVAHPIGRAIPGSGRIRLL
jgi:selenide,water dikinase